MAVSLVRRSECGSKLEATEGTGEALVAADFATTKKSQRHTYTPGEYDREVQRRTLTPLQMVKASRQLEIGWVQEMTGGAAATPATWDTDLQACGFKSTQLKKIATGTNTANFAPGQLIGNNTVYASSTAKGMVIAVLASSPKVVVYKPINGTFASGDTLYNQEVSQATVLTTGAPADAGRVYELLTEGVATVPSATVERRFGGEIHRAVAARATANITFGSNSVPLMDVTYSGCAVLDSSGNPTTDPDNLTITLPATPPLPNQSMPIAFGSLQPVLTEIRVDLGNSVTMRPTISNTDYAGTGFRGARITNRRVMLTASPEKDIGDTLGEVRRTMVNETFPVSIEYGKRGNANGQLFVWAPAVQLTGAHTPGDSNGIQTAPLNMMATGSGDDEMWIAHVFA